MPARRVEKGTGIREMLDHLAGPHHVETAAQVHGLRVGNDHRETARRGAPGERRIELDSDDLGRDAGNECVHPIRSVHARTGADVEHAPAREMMPDARESVGVRPGLPVIRLQRVLPGHGAERTAGSRTAAARTAAAMLALLVVTACSESVDSTSSTSTSAPCSTVAPPPSNPAERKAVPVDGSGDRNVGLPAELSPPLIVHARHNGSGSFVVRGLDAAGNETQVLATALGRYDGTFAVGFVDACTAPTVGLHIAASGPWHLDLADARFAPVFVNGVAGKGDSVFTYNGKATKAVVTFSGRSRFVATTFGAGGPKLLARSTGPTRVAVALPKGPIFIAVTAEGAWSIRPS